MDDIDGEGAEQMSIDEPESWGYIHNGHKETRRPKGYDPDLCRDDYYYLRDEPDEDGGL